MLVFQVKIYFALMHLHPLDMRITYRSTPGQEVQDADELTLSTIAQLNDARYSWIVYKVPLSVQLCSWTM